MTYGTKLTVPVQLAKATQLCAKLCACVHACKATVPSRSKITGQHQTGVVKHHQKHAKTSQKVNFPNSAL
jgi:hypothetical protein